MVDKSVRNTSFLTCLERSLVMLEMIGREQCCFAILPLADRLGGDEYLRGQLLLCQAQFLAAGGDALSDVRPSRSPRLKRILCLPVRFPLRHLPDNHIITDSGVEMVACGATLISAPMSHFEAIKRIR